MKQILQNLRTGVVEAAEVPSPITRPGHVLIQTGASLISAGTERMLVEFSQANLIQKARSQPDKVKQVLDKIRTDGLMPTLEAVFRKLDQPLPLGYCNAGTVLEVGVGVTDLQPDDRVISNGNHAEIVCVPRNLVARIPDGVNDENAAFTVLGAIALQGVRLVQPTLGEKIIVFGMGLIGLITVQLLRSCGCEVLAVDLNSERLELARRFGAVTADLSKGAEPIAAARGLSRGQGVDAAIITASAKNDDIVHQAAESCRIRGRIVLVGVVGLNLRRSDFYRKELSFQVSCSYGPGRYDEAYEQAGHDYPLGFVRWTEGRNFEAVLGAMAGGSLEVSSLITHRFKFHDAVKAYETIANDNSALGVVLEYGQCTDRSSVVTVTQSTVEPEHKAVVGVIGAGNFAGAILLPALSKAKAHIAYIADLNGTSAKDAAHKFKIEHAVCDYKLVLADERVKAIFILVGHNLHSRLVCEALEAGKHVFVEKPLAMNTLELECVCESVSKSRARLLMLGFNRRFSPHTITIKELLTGRAEPLCMSMTVNGGEIAPEHWIQDPERGGGRIIGEGCHFMDLLAYIAGSPIVGVSAMMMGEGPPVREDKMAIVLRFADGSVGTVNYFSNGPKSYPKEILEVFGDGRVLRMENFRVTKGFGFKRFKKFKTASQDKGHFSEIAQFIDRIEKGGEPPIPFSEMVNVTLASFAAVISAREGRLIDLGREFALLCSPLTGQS